MANDPRDTDGKNLQKALYLLGRNKNLRKQLIDFLKDSESSFDGEGSVRDEVTGPIIDALHDENDIYEKSLADGTHFKFLFRTKIARDFMLAVDEHPTHVWEPQTTKLLLNLTENMKQDVLVGGAYFGDQAILVAKNLTNNNRIVHCFEPNTEQAEMLQENSRLNALQNIRFNSLGLWEESGVRMRLDGFDSFANAVKAESNEDGFDTISIDDYQKQLDIEIGLIQLDIEGAELSVIKGGANTLSLFKPHIIFEVHRDYVDWSKGLENIELCSLLHKFGYSIFAIRDFNTHYEMTNKPIELIPSHQVYLEGPPHGFNMIAVLDETLFNSSEYKIVEDVSPKLLFHKDPALHHPTDGL